MRTGNNNSQLNRARENKDDEFYTPEWYADLVVNEYREFLCAKRVWLPCDSEKSELTKRLLKEDDVEIINTSDDYRKHGKLLEWSEVIVTNPPFSKLVDFFDFVSGGGVDFVLILPQNLLTRKNLFNAYMNKKLWFNWKQEHIMFNRPDGTQKEMSIYLVSSFKKHRAPSGPYIDDVLYLKRWEDFVPTYTGKIGVPVTAAFQIDLEHYDILGKGRAEGFYERIIIQRKKESLISEAQNKTTQQTFL